MPNNCFFNIILVLTSFFISGFNAQADSHQSKEMLNWDEVPKQVSINEQTQYDLYGFEGADYDGRIAGLPQFIKSYPVSSYGTLKVNLKNKVFEPVAAGLYPVEIEEQISDAVFVKSSLEKARNQYSVDVKIIPLKKLKDGSLQKLVSFEVDIQLNPIQKRTKPRIYANNSKLSSGDWYKVAVGDAGIYQLNADILEQIGADVANVAIDEVKVHTNSGGMLPEANSAENFDDLVETPVQIIDQNNNNKFDANDGILFYVPGINVWKFDEDADRYIFTKHLYSNTNYILVNTNGTKSKSIITKNENLTANNTTAHYDILSVHESQNYNLIYSGREWYGELFEFVNEYNITLDLPNVVTSEPALITSRFAARSIGASSSFNVKVNNTDFQTHYIDRVSSANYTLEADVSMLSNLFTLNGSNQLNFDIRYNATAPGAQGWLDYIEVNAKGKIIHNNKQLLFSNKNTISNDKITTFEIEGSGNLNVWDVTSVRNISALPLSNRSFTTKTNVLKKFVAFNQSTAMLPTSGEKIENQNVHGESAVDYLIVSHPDFLSEAERLADFHKELSNLKALIVTPEKIYREFSNGIPDVTAIRNFVRHFYYSKNEAPKYLLLFGDASYDYLNLEFDATVNTNFVPTFESHESRHSIYTFCTDDYFTLMDADEGAKLSETGKPDLAVGRIPCSTLAEAQNVVDKIIHYKTIASKGSWQNIYTMLADDEDGNLHFNDSESHCKKIENLEPCINIEKIYLDAYEQESTTGGGRYPEVNEALDRRIENGTLVLNYVGHGGENGFAHERVCQIAQINDWDNMDNLPLFVTATCSFSRFDNPDWFSAGERVVLRANGGAIANVTTVRVVYASQNKRLNAAFIDHFFTKENNRHLPIGTIVQYAKENTAVSPNVRKFALLGDPALVLNYPEYKVMTTKINDTDFTAFNDTLKSLSKVKISGQVVGFDNAKMEGFNGTIFPSIYDKAITTTTLGNDEGSSRAEFNTQSNIIFKGQSKITNGSFNFEFIIPKDINLFYGNGKISYYALDESTGNDAKGCDTIMVGGIANEAAQDKQKPVIELFMNNTDFVFGGTTNENPDLLALLSDDSGINTVGNGIGHNITAIVDGDESNPIILNDYYQAKENDFTQGAIRYPFKNLEEGKHSITLRAFDVYNNWNEAYLEFNVFHSDDVQITNVLNYPNPFTTYTEFYFEHNQSAENLEAQINIYALTGRLVKTLKQPLPAGAFRVKAFTWDGLDDYNNKLGRGTYIYKVVLYNGEQTFSSNYQKLMLLR